MSTETKTAIFNRVVSTRDELKEIEIADASESIQRRVLLMEEFRTARRVGLYLAHRNEVRTDLLFTEGDRYRKEIYYPKAVSEGEALDYYRVITLDDLERCEDGSSEPSGRQSRLRDMDDLDVLIVPGVAFDLQGCRMGWGRGFYDACLENFRGTRVALAYEFQIVGQLPMGVRGKRVDWIITDTRMIRCS